MKSIRQLDLRQLSGFACWCAVFAFATFLMVACGDAPTATSRQSAVTTYPLDICLVAKEKLGSMGDPITYVHKGRQVKFCCAGCVDEFKSKPDHFLAELDDLAAKTPTAKRPGAEGPGHEGHDHSAH